MIVFVLVHVCIIMFIVTALLMIVLKLMSVYADPIMYTGVHHYYNDIITVKICGSICNKVIN